jgi:hypothetical protein
MVELLRTETHYRKSLVKLSAVISTKAEALRLAVEGALTTGQLDDGDVQFSLWSLLAADADDIRRAVDDLLLGEEAQ